MTYLLDTGIITELVSTNPDPAVLRWLDSQPEETVYISVVTLAEICESIQKEKSLAKKALLTAWLTNDLLVRFSGRIGEISVGVSLKWGEIMAKLKALGHTLSIADSMILAIALVYGHTLVTRDIASFKGTGAKVFSPFEGPENS
jgi:hypothetical protein